MAQQAFIMFLAGVGIPVLAALNAALGRHVGSPATAAAVLFVIAFAVAATVALLTRPDAARDLAGAPRHLFLAGLFVAFYILSITWIAPVMGLGNAIFFVLLGQLVSAAVIDQWGLLHALPRPVTPARAAGIALMAVGVFLTQRG